MLSLNEIRNVHFRKSNFSGYKAEDVEAFIDEVQQSYDQLLKENADLQKKVDVLAQKLEDYQREEDAIRSALMNAQKLGDASLRDAKHKSEIILKDATIKAEKIVANSQTEIKREKEIVDRMQKDVADFKTNLLKLYKDHLQLINNIRSDTLLRPATREAAESVQIIAPQHEENMQFEPDIAPSFSGNNFEPSGNLQMNPDFSMPNFEQPSMPSAPASEPFGPGFDAPSQLEMPSNIQREAPSFPESAFENTYSRMQNSEFERTPARGGFKVNISGSDPQMQTMDNIPPEPQMPPMGYRDQQQYPPYGQQPSMDHYQNHSNFRGQQMPDFDDEDVIESGKKKFPSPLGLFKKKK